MKTAAIINLLLFIQILNSYSQNISCFIKGEVNDTACTHLILVKENENARQTGLEIPLNGNTFQYRLEVEYKEAYTLFLNNEIEKGVAYGNEFIAENDTLIFDIYPYEIHIQNTIMGGELTQGLQEFYRFLYENFEPKLLPFYSALDSLDIFKNLYNSEMELINRKIQEETDNEKKQLLYKTKNYLIDSRDGYTPQALFYYSKIDSVVKVANDWLLDEISKNQNELSYYILLSLARMYSNNEASINTDKFNRLVQDFTNNYSSHPYTQKLNYILNSLKSVRTGNPYLNFSAQNIDGKLVQISDLIEGKIALINFWASWCGPCLALNRSMIPVYEKYKNKGFTIIGIAREYKNSNAFINTLDKEQYPWKNLLELDDQNRIWEKYGISNSAGATFLVNEDGVIVSIHPDAKELDRFLSKMLD